MRAEDITPETVKATLRAIRYGKRLATNPFLDHGAVRLRLRDQGHADTPINREWMLQQYLLVLVSGTIAALRVELGVAGVAGGDLAQLVADYRAGSQTLEAWSLLYARYLAPAEPPEGKVLAGRLGATVKTLTRRLGIRPAPTCVGAGRRATRPRIILPGYYQVSPEEIPAITKGDALVGGRDVTECA